MSVAYSAAYDGAVFFRRSSRRLRKVTGRAPTAMLAGVLSGAMPPDLEPSGDGILRGRASCSALLTPKGRMITDLRVARLENGEGGALLLDLPDRGLAGATAHFGRFLPPRMAHVEELNAETGILTVVGPDSAEVIRGAGMPLALEAGEMLALAEGDERVLPGEAETGTRLVREAEVLPHAFDVVADSSKLNLLRSRLVEDGVLEGDEALWHVLRLEKGRPAFGIEMDEETIPLEAGIQDRCIDSAKGCYTGQEVIVRIRDRGHVNRHLRGILLGTAPPPPDGTPLFHPGGDDKPIGTIRSSARSPRFGQAIALAYVRREIEPPKPVALGAPDGPEVHVRALTSQGWLLVDGDPTPYP